MEKIFKLLLQISIFALLCGLGIWQLTRGLEKSSIEADFDNANLVTRPIVLSADKLESATDFNYRVVQIEGIFDNNHQYILDNRTHKGRAGYLVISPFIVENKVLLVNRGWQMWNDSRTPLPQQLMDEPIAIIGRLGEIIRPGLLLGENGYSQPHWPKVVQLIDPIRIQQELGKSVLPFMLWLPNTAELTNIADNNLEKKQKLLTSGLVSSWNTKPKVSSDRHFGYTFQWFTLAITWVLLLSFLYSKRGREQAKSGK